MFVFKCGLKFTTFKLSWKFSLTTANHLCIKIFVPFICKFHCGYTVYFQPNMKGFSKRIVRSVLIYIYYWQSLKAMKEHWIYIMESQLNRNSFTISFCHDHSPFCLIIQKGHETARFTQQKISLKEYIPISYTDSISMGNVE